MSINANYLVSLPPRTIRGGSTDLETNGMLLTKSALIPTETIAMSFVSATDVGNFFGPESDEYQFAQQYFTGLTNQQHAPTTLVIGRRVGEACAAWIRSAELSVDLAALKAVTDGALKITVDGTEKTASTVDLSGATSLSNAAELIATAITGVTGTYDSNTNTFTFTSSTTGAESTITFASAGDGGTDLSEMLGLTFDAGAVLSQGMDALSEAANLDRIVAVDANWTQFTTLWEVEDADEAEGYAAWADVDDDYIYVFWSGDEKMCDQLTQSTTVASQLNGEYDCTFMLYARDFKAAAFAVAYPATIKWDQEQGMKVLFGKTASGLEPTVTDEASARALDDLRVSYVGQFATRNAEFQFANRGAMASTHYGFYDVLVGMIWFRAKIQRSIMDGFAAVNRVPYTPRGYNLISTWITGPINEAVNVGVIDANMTLSDAQRSQIMQETGSNEAPTDIESNGFWLEVSDPTAAVRANRGTPVMNLYYAYAGSVQTVEMPVTAVL